MNILTVSINAECNLACEFCYQELDGSKLSVDDVLSHVKENQRVQIDGGEPMLYQDISGLVKTIAKTNPVHISTNAVYIPKDFLDLDGHVRNNTEVQVSLHASNPKLFKDITKHDKFGQVMDNIEKLSDSYVTGLSCAVYGKNLDDIPNIVKLSKSLDLPLRVNLVFPINNDVTILDMKQIDQLKGYLLSQKVSGARIDSPLLHDNSCNAIAKHYCIEKRGSCPVDCMSKTYVSSKGSIRSCEFLGE